MDRRTLFVNLFGGPGTGKSTTAAWVFAKLKDRGANAELVQEYAKDRTWQRDHTTLKFQPYVTGKQMYRQFRLLGEVDVAVTDSPCILGVLYQGFGCVDGWEEVLVRQFREFWNLNVFLRRNASAHAYNPRGRNQTEAEAAVLDAHTVEMLERHGIGYTDITVRSGGGHVDGIVQMAVTELAARDA